MAPNVIDPDSKSSESEENEVRSRVKADQKTNNPCDSARLNQSAPQKSNPQDDKPVFVPQIRWPDLLAQLFIHVGSLYGLYYLITLQAKAYTYVWCKKSSLIYQKQQKSIFCSVSVVVLVYTSGIGITAGLNGFSADR